MAQQYTTQNVKIRTSVLVFIKGSSAPIVLYVEKPLEFYEELQQMMTKPTPILVEKETQGPIKKVCFQSNQVVGIALQDEQYV